MVSVKEQNLLRLRMYLLTSLKWKTSQAGLKTGKRGLYSTMKISITKKEWRDITDMGREF